MKTIIVNKIPTGSESENSQPRSKKVFGNRLKLSNASHTDSNLRRPNFYRICLFKGDPRNVKYILEINIDSVNILMQFVL